MRRRKRLGGKSLLHESILCASPSSLSLTYIVHRWTKPINMPLSDQLLTIIEDSTKYKVTFGFDKGDVTSINSSGKKTSDHHKSITQKLFINTEDSNYTEDDIMELGGQVKN